MRRSSHGLDGWLRGLLGRLTQLTCSGRVRSGESVHLPSLRPIRQNVDNPASPDVWTRSSAVVENIGVFAPGILESVGEDRKAVEGSIGVDAFGEGKDGRGEPGWVEGDGAEGVAEDVPNERHLRRALFPFTRMVAVAAN